MSFQVRKFISNEFACIVFPEKICKATFEFLGHNENINRLLYCCPDLAKTFRDIAPALHRINDNFFGEDLAWDDNASSDPCDVTDPMISIPTGRQDESTIIVSSISNAAAKAHSNMLEIPTSLVSEDDGMRKLEQSKAIAAWTPKRRMGAHQFFQFFFSISFTTVTHNFLTILLKCNKLHIWSK